MSVYLFANFIFHFVVPKLGETLIGCNTHMRRDITTCFVIKSNQDKSGLTFQPPILNSHELFVVSNPWFLLGKKRIELLIHRFEWLPMASQH